MLFARAAERASPPRSRLRGRVRNRGAVATGAVATDVATGAVAAAGVAAAGALAEGAMW
jgi:hypothetical protein